MRIGRLVIWLLLAVAIAGVATALAMPEARWRLVVLGRFATGQIEEMSIADLRRLLMPGSGFYPKRLADSPNPFLGIINPFTSPSDIAAGASTFGKRCAQCHGTGGTGGTGVRLLDELPKRGSSDWALYRTIRYGVAGTPMPAHEDIDWRASWQLVAYVAGLVRGDAGAGDAAELPRKSVARVEGKEIPAFGGAGGDWLTYSGSLDGIRFSRLDEITAANVTSLRLAWLVQLEQDERRNEMTPLAWDGLLFVSQPPGSVLALEAGSGRKRWQWSRPVPKDVQLCCSMANRGVALLGDKVFVGTLDAHLVALDSTTGRELWNTEVADHRQGYSITGAPLIAGNLVVTGVGGGEFGIRGFVDAYDPDTGERRWRFHTIPQPDEPGFETWDPAAMATGGAPTWMTGSYDAGLNIIYWGVGNPAPDYNADRRPGDNLYSESVLALDATTGKLRWHFQFTPNDEHDWDANHVPLLVDSTAFPDHPKLLLNPNRNGFYYVLDRMTGHFLTGVPFVRQSWAEGLTESGRPIETARSRPSRTGTLTYPSAAGATNWWPASFSPQTGLVYVPSVDDRSSVFFKSDETLKRVEGELWLGSGAVPPGAGKHRTAVKALDPWSGAVVWQAFRKPRIMIAETGGLLSTAGGLVFGSDLHEFFALDARTGRLLWSVDLGGDTVAAPMTFLHNGRQHVVIASGKTLVAFRLP